jgi:fructose-1,6-bisphosphatase/inositol monophosphatase family enzyme
MSDDLAVAVEAAQAAGAELLRRFRRPLLELASKSGRGEDLASEADRAAEAAARGVLTRLRPADAILGEELGQTGEGERIWLLDPLDGTVYYSRGLEQWSVSLALEADEKTTLGVVLDPLGGELWSAAVDGLQRNSESWTSSERRLTLAESHLALNLSMLRDRDGDQAGLLLDAFRHVERFRDFGSPARTLAHVAAGRIDLAFYDTPRLYPWDVAAGLHLCRAAGLTVRRLEPWQSANERILVGPLPLVDKLASLLPS